MEDDGRTQKKRSIDDIIEHMTTDIRISDGHYVPLGVSPPPSTPYVWSEYSSLINDNSDKHSYPSSQPMGQGGNAIFFPDTSNVCKEVNTPHLPNNREIYLPPNFYYGTPTKQPLNVVPENRKVLGTVVDGDGNIVSIVYSDSDTATQPYCIMACENRESSLNPMGEFNPFQRVDLDPVGSCMQDYSFNNSNQQQQPQQSQSHSFHDTVNRAQLIENFVGNWVPTQNGTYSPFGCTDIRMRQVHMKNQQAMQTSSSRTCESLMDQKLIDRNVKKDRLVAEVHPMRPSYSDVLTKSAPSTSPPLKSNPIITDVNDKAYMPNISKSKVTSMKSNSSKRNNRNSALKRQHSSGSEEHSNTNMNSNKLNHNLGLNQKSTANCLKHSNFECCFDELGLNSLSRKWVSLDDLDNHKEAVELGEEIFQTENMPSETGTSLGDTVSGENKKSFGPSRPKSKYEKE
ncbi:hypothetical protein L9F63_013989, partial [Diploptera punctata]